MLGYLADVLELLVRAGGPHIGIGYKEPFLNA